MIFLILFALQCSPPSNFEVIPPIIESPPKENTTITAIAERVKQSESGFILFSETEEILWVRAYVISSDEGGNFYKEIYLQDKTEKAAVGMRILLDKTALYTHYGLGEKIIIRLNGIGAGYHRGVLSIGSYQVDGIASLTETQISSHIIRTDTIEELVPESTPINSIVSQTVGTLIELENVQFGKGEINKTFSGEAFDTFDGERRLVSCDDQQSLFLSTSNYSKFKSVVLDSLSGTISGILTRDYYDNKYILRINSPAQINFLTPRCDLFFEMPFEEETLGKFEKNGWFNFIEKGSVYWKVYEDANSLGQSLQIGAYRSGDKASVCWLITPNIDLSGLNLPQLAFRTSTSFADKSKLEVFYSVNFEGSIAGIKKAKWKRLNGSIASKDEDDLLWIDSGLLALPEKDRVAIAFVYSGSSKSDFDGTFELDDIRILEGQ